MHRGATIVEGEYGAAIVTRPPDRKELTDAERAAARKADRMPLKEVFRFGEQNFDTAKAFGMPASLGRIVTNDGRDQGEPLWSRQKLAIWRNGLKAFVSGLK